MTVCQQPPSVVTNFIQVHPAIYGQKQGLIVVGEVMFVSGLPFLVTVSQSINIVTSKYLPDVTVGMLSTGLLKPIRGKGFFFKLP